MLLTLKSLTSKFQPGCEKCMQSLHQIFDNYLTYTSQKKNLTHGNTTSSATEQIKNGGFVTGSKGVNQNGPNMVWNKLRQVLEWSSEEFIRNFSSVDDKQYMQCGLASVHDFKKIHLIIYPLKLTLLRKLLNHIIKLAQQYKRNCTVDFFTFSQEVFSRFLPLLCTAVSSTTNYLQKVLE